MGEINDNLFHCSVHWNTLYAFWDNTVMRILCCRPSYGLAVQPSFASAILFGERAKAKGTWAKLFFVLLWYCLRNRVKLRMNSVKVLTWWTNVSALNAQEFLLLGHIFNWKKSGQATVPDFGQLYFKTLHDCKFSIPCDKRVTRGNFSRKQVSNNTILMYTTIEQIAE